MVPNGKTKWQHAVIEARRLTNKAVKELGAEAVKLREIAEVEFRDLVGEARTTGRRRFARLGRDLVKLGHRIEKIGRHPKQIPARRRPPRRQQVPNL